MVINIQLLRYSEKTSTINCKFSATMVDTDAITINDINFYSSYETKVSQVSDNKGEDYIADKVFLDKSESKTYLTAYMVKD